MSLLPEAISLLLLGNRTYFNRTSRPRSRFAEEICASYFAEYYEYSSGGLLHTNIRHFPVEKQKAILEAFLKSTENTAELFVKVLKFSGENEHSVFLYKDLENSLKISLKQSK